MAAQRLAALRRGPELVPAPDGAVVHARLFVNDRQLSDPGADVDVRLRAEGLEILFDAGVLPERLDESTEGEMHHRSHLVVELCELRGREALIEPGAVAVELELRLADEKVRRPEAAKRREPRAAFLEIARECLDVGRLRSDDAPAEDPDALTLSHRRGIVANPVRKLA